MFAVRIISLRLRKIALALAVSRNWVNADFIDGASLNSRRGRSEKGQSIDIDLTRLTDPVRPGQCQHCLYYLHITIESRGQTEWLVAITKLGLKLATKLFATIIDQHSRISAKTCCK